MPTITNILDGRICGYCSGKPLLVSSKIVYSGRDFGPIWRCPDCGAYVGCHPGTVKPLGRLANAELRYWKKLAHDSFDPLWKDGVINKVWPKFIHGVSNRTKAYMWLSNKLGIPKERMHIGQLSIEDCKKVVELCKLEHYGVGIEQNT